MSFGSGVSDFIAVGELAWKIYRDCYKVARSAPSEFQLLVGEIAILSNSLTILQEEIRDPESTLVRAGEDRVCMVNEMVSSIGTTLERLGQVARKFDILGSNSKRKQLWAKFKWSTEISSIDALRNKLIYHNTVMSLLLTSVGNSSLQRIESSNALIESDVKVIRSYIESHQPSEKPNVQETSDNLPALSVSSSDDALLRTTLTTAFMKSAQLSQPWNTIGVEHWIEAGRWWLLKFQIEHHTISTTNHRILPAAYTNLIKASWILVDVIAGHPQYRFLAANTQSEVQLLSRELKTEFTRLSIMNVIVPNSKELEGQDLRIWESQNSLLRPPSGLNNVDTCGDERILFRRFAVYVPRVFPEPLPCILLLLIRKNLKSSRIIAQNQTGSVIMEINIQKGTMTDSAVDYVSINDEQIKFPLVHDAQYLKCLIEGTRFYLFDRKAEKYNKEDFEAYLLLTAIKNHLDQKNLARLSEELCLKPPSTDGKSMERAHHIAYTLAHQEMRHGRNEEDLAGSYSERSKLSLFAWAIRCGHVTLVKLLVEEQTTTDGNDWHGMTPLGLASFWGHESVAQILIADRTSIQTVDGHSCVPLHYAAFKGHEGVGLLLLKSGAETETKDSEGLTPLHYAARGGREKVAQLLIGKGANIEAKGHKGFTPLLEAVLRGKEKIAVLLLEEGANAAAKSKEGVNAGHIALDVVGSSIDGMNDGHLEHDNETTLSDACVEMILRKINECQQWIGPTFGRNLQSGSENDLVRRARLIIEVDSDWACLWLDTYKAYIEKPNDIRCSIIEISDHIPSNIISYHRKTIWIARRRGSPTQFFCLKFHCTVVYHGVDFLDFSVAHGTLGLRGYGTIKIKVVNGGERIGQPNIYGGRNFQSFRNVELDPNAEILRDQIDVDQEVPGISEHGKDSPANPVHEAHPELHEFSKLRIPEQDPSGEDTFSKRRRSSERPGRPSQSRLPVLEAS